MVKLIRPVVLKRHYGKDYSVKLRLTNDDVASLLNRPLSVRARKRHRGRQLCYVDGGGAPRWVDSRVLYETV